MDERDNNIPDADVDMIDVEEGELVESNSQNVLGQSSVEDITEANQETHSENSKCGVSKKKKKKNKRKRKGSGSGSGSGSNVMNIDRFVLDTCRRLKEKKSYMVYTAAGCLGISALSDIIKEIFLPDASLLLPMLCLIFGVPG
ncbi:hypothetical protein TSUD_315460 [Trifolium subterraneum]|uniref:Uncharacterized protein n=1 Tax=Trifolium subterraneum TaxID=3900 RepID=A0A2Z6MF24_TRISU|nr:hypothetical protein TSUD_315460 [Trifolium subterraneum]